jgi:hypothetical protein
VRKVHTTKQQTQLKNNSIQPISEGKKVDHKLSTKLQPKSLVQYIEIKKITCSERIDKPMLTLTKTAY